MSYEPDQYGSHYRESLKKSMEHPFVAHNRRQHTRKEPLDLATFLWMIVALLAGTILWLGMDKLEGCWRGL